MDIIPRSESEFWHLWNYVLEYSLISPLDIVYSAASIGISLPSKLEHKPFCVEKQGAFTLHESLQQREICVYYMWSCETGVRETTSTAY